jgi:N-acetylmuramoyl-L-alanine amidase
MVVTERVVAGSGVQSWTEDARTFCLRPGQGCLKILNTARDAGAVRRFHELNPLAPVIYRGVRGDDLAGLAARTEQSIHDTEDLAAFLGDLLLVEVEVNEAYQTGADLSRLADGTITAVRRLRAAGRRPVIGNFSVGNPQLAGAALMAVSALAAPFSERVLARPAVKRSTRPVRPAALAAAVPLGDGDWARFAPAVAEAIGARGVLGLHEYSAPGLPWWDGWLNGRYARALDELAALGLRPEVGIGEHFVDGGVLDGRLRGWRAFDLTDAQGAALLDESLARYARDPRVKYVALFEGGPYEEWRRRGFEYDTSTPIRDALERRWPVTSPEEPTMIEWCPFATRAELPPGLYGETRDNGAVPAMICDHIADGNGDPGPYWISLLGQPENKRASAHLWVSKTGQLRQYVRFGAQAWSNGPICEPDLSNHLIAAIVQHGANPNACTISIEHEGRPGEVMPPAQVAMSRRVHRWLSETFNIPLDRTDVVGHSQFDHCSRARCPGPTFPWSEILMGTPTPPTSALTPILDRAWSRATQADADAKMLRAMNDPNLTWLAEHLEGSAKSDRAATVLTKVAKGLQA